MMIHAYKYQGAGNDFVILDNREGAYDSLTSLQINFLCNRRFGIGGDGLMLLGKSGRYDFSMRYFNADGYEGSMCGNGGRCLVAFAAHRGIEKFEFEAIDGYHTAQVLTYTPVRCEVRLKMIDLKQYERYSENAWVMNTGSPHYVEFVEGVLDYPVEEKGKFWRHHPHFQGGTNVNFVQAEPDRIIVRTYERGVETETYACGTGVTASAIAAFLHRENGFSKKEELAGGKVHATYSIQALGDQLAVDFIYHKNDKAFQDIYLTGPATFVFECDLTI